MGPLEMPVLFGVFCFDDAEGTALPRAWTAAFLLDLSDSVMSAFDLRGYVSTILIVDQADE